MYKVLIKRLLDVICSLLALVILSPLLVILTLANSFIMRGNPFFVQVRPGKKGKNGQEKLFRLFKFRSMSDAKDKEGNLLPDEKRLNSFGKILRSTSLDELPEIINILKGDMSVIGPRPQLVKDMVFMTEEQRHRHDVRPGLSGLAQVNGRNSIDWIERINLDLEYVKHVTLLEDVSLVFKTLVKVFLRDGISEQGMATSMDYGDFLLHIGRISEQEYNEKQNEANSLLANFGLSS